MVPTRFRIILRTQKGTIVLTTTHMVSSSCFITPSFRVEVANQHFGGSQFASDVFP